MLGEPVGNRLRSVARRRRWRTFQIPVFPILPKGREVEEVVVRSRATEWVIQKVDGEDVAHALDVEPINFSADLCARYRRRNLVKVSDVVDLHSQYHGELVRPDYARKILGRESDFHEI